MKKIACALFASLLFVACPAAAQAAIALERMNAICLGIDNPIIVAVNDVPDSNLLLIPSMGSITSHGSGHYDWRICHRDTNFATLTIRDTVAQQEIGTFTYRVLRPPGGCADARHNRPAGQYAQRPVQGTGRDRHGL